jgi:hypothetical protein
MTHIVCIVQKEDRRKKEKKYTKKGDAWNGRIAAG